MTVVEADFIKALELFNNKYFWECHEVLEELWLEELDPTKKFYQGLIQSAAALYHVLNNNPRGCIKLTQDSLEKLKDFQPQYMGVELDPLVTQMKKILDEAYAIEKGQLKEFDLQKIPQIKTEGLH